MHTAERGDICSKIKYFVADSSADMILSNRLLLLTQTSVHEYENVSFEPVSAHLDTFTLVYFDCSPFYL